MAFPSTLVLVSWLVLASNTGSGDTRTELIWGRCWTGLQGITKLSPCSTTSPFLQRKCILEAGCENLGSVSKFAAFPSIPPSKNFFLPTFVSRHCLK